MQSVDTTLCILINYIINHPVPDAIDQSLLDLLAVTDAAGLSPVQCPDLSPAEDPSPAADPSPAEGLSPA